MDHRWRTPEAAAEPAKPSVAEPAPIAAPDVESAAAMPVAMPETEATIEMEPDLDDAVPTDRAPVSVKTTKRARPRARAKTVTKKATPTCDIYLYPHGCPK